MLVKGTHKIPSRITSLLLVQLGDIGDVVLTTPTLKALREGFPGTRIHLALRDKARGLLDDSPLVDEVIYISKKKRSFLEEIAFQLAFFRNLRKKDIGLSIDLRTGTRGAILSFLSGAAVRVGRYAEDGTLWRNRLFTHLVEPQDERNQHCSEHGLNILAPFNLKIRSCAPELFVSQGLRERALDILRQEKAPLSLPFIAIQPFSLWRYKEWPADNYVRLIKWIKSDFSLPVMIIGSAEEGERAFEMARDSGPGTYNLAGKTSLAELKALLKFCHLLIGGDSAGIHIASAVGTPTVSLFGPSSPVSWAPGGKDHLVISKDWPCVPCREKGCGNTERSRCIEELSFEEVKASLEKMISRSQGTESGLNQSGEEDRR